MEVTPQGNATIPPSGSIEAGYVANYSGAKPVPSGVRLGGQNCNIVVK
jgi:hypothetical protein